MSANKLQRFRTVSLVLYDVSAIVLYFIFADFYYAAGLGEFRIRDLNDEINKLLREKRRWEERIMQLGGADLGNLRSDSVELISVPLSETYFTYILTDMLQSVPSTVRENWATVYGQSRRTGTRRWLCET